MKHFIPTAVARLHSRSKSACDARQFIRRTCALSGFLSLSLIMGCASTKPDSSNEPHTPAIPEPPAQVADVQPALTTQPMPEEPAHSSAPIATPPSVEPNVPIATKKPATPVEKTPASKIDTPTQPAASAPTATNQSRTNQPAAVAAPLQSPPSLDLPALEKRLRETRAIGVMTKLSLKNQVDDLLDEFRASHQGKSKTPPAALRQRYDLLMMKVLTLLQDDDTALAASILSSREAIWSVLSDPKRFAQLG